MKYNVFSPDGFSIHHSDTYNSKAAARRALKAWVKNYEHQGYYSSGRRRISLLDLPAACDIRVVEPLDYRITISGSGTPDDIIKALKQLISDIRAADTSDDLDCRTFEGPTLIAEIQEDISDDEPGLMKENEYPHRN